jgi:hypothetical protein
MIRIILERKALSDKRRNKSLNMKQIKLKYQMLNPKTEDWSV